MSKQFVHYCGLPVNQGERAVQRTAPTTMGTLEDELTSAAATGNTAEVARLLRAGADVNAPNRLSYTALQVRTDGRETPHTFSFNLCVFHQKENNYERDTRIKTKIH